MCLNQKILSVTILFVSLFSISGCQAKEPVLSRSTDAPVNSVQEATPQPPEPLPIYLSPSLPQPAAKILLQNLPDKTIQVDDPAAGAVRIEIGEKAVVSRWVYALAAPFPTVPDQVTIDQLKEFWQSGFSSGFPAQVLLVTENTKAVFSEWWGKPADKTIQTITPDRIVNKAWNDKQTTWALIPFEEIQPRWKILQVDGQSPLHKDFSLDNYPLSVPISITIDENRNGMSEFRLKYAGLLPASNRDPEKLTTVMLTGVTALVRGTAAMMEVLGVEYPARDLMQELKSADILHINNEVPFTPRCTQPPVEKDLVFCSKPKYFGLLEAIGTDVIDLSGDHFQDFGDEAVLYTLDLYKQNNLPYYGGGYNIEDARKPLKMEHNGNKIAFLGCNAKPPGYASASAIRPGAVHCDFDYLVKEIKQLRSEGFLPIVTFQHLEYYSFTAHPILVADFQRVAAAGAVIVSGSQAHLPQAAEFYKDSFLHYGLGNLFFDQYYESEETRQAFIDRHVFYDGNYLGVEWLTIEFEDIARARPMFPMERETLLNTIFSASGWTDPVKFNSPQEIKNGN